MLLWESMLVQGVVLWVYCGHHFLVQMGYCGNHVWYRGCTVGVRWESFLVKKGVQWVAFLVQGVVVWVYCGKQFLVLRCVLWVALLILRGYVGIHVWYCGNKEIVGQGWHYGRTPCAAQKYPTEEGKRSMVLCEF